MTPRVAETMPGGQMARTLCISRIQPRRDLQNRRPRAELELTEFAARSRAGPLAARNTFAKACESAVFARLRRLAHQVHQRASVLKRLRNTEGATLLEAAIITPLLLLLTFSIVDFGAMFYVYLALENGVSQATRYGITNSLMDDPANPGNRLNRPESMKLAMRQSTPTLTIPDGGFSFAHRAVGGASWVAGSGAPNDIEKMTVAYTWNVLTPVLWPFFNNGQIVLTVDSVMKNEAPVE
jgi:hypothetical protein